MGGSKGTAPSKRSGAYGLGSWLAFSNAAGPSAAPERPHGSGSLVVLGDGGGEGGAPPRRWFQNPPPRAPGPAHALVPSPEASVRVIASSTSRPRAKRTSAFCGCTFTSTSFGSSST